MLIGIAPKRASEDVVDALLECHERIRGFVELARRLGEHGELPAEEVRQAASRVHRYFSLALPLHVRDEEESILPRLHGLGGAIADALDRMARQHAEHEPPLARLLELCAVLGAQPEKHTTLRDDLASVASRLEREFQEHLESEERYVFPAIRERLRASDRFQLAVEIRERRAAAARRNRH